MQVPIVMHIFIDKPETTHYPKQQNGVLFNRKSVVIGKGTIMSENTMSPVHELSVVLGNYPHTLPIKEGGIVSPRVKLNFIEGYKPLSRAFDDMVEKQAFDVCEMAVATFLQALDSGKPLRLMPVVMGGEFHHGSLLYNPANGPLTPGDLKGRRVGVKAYTQTTGLWVRGVLQEQYGVLSDDVTWVTTEAPHVAEFTNPSNVELVEGGNLVDMLTSGEIAAVIMGPKQTKGLSLTLQQVIPDVDTAIAGWYAKHQAVPANHMVVVTDALLEKDFAVVQDAYNMFKQGIETTQPAASAESPSALQVGAENVWAVVQLAMQYALEQKLVSRAFDRKEIFGEMLSFA